MLILVRHGESELNARNCLVGRLDPALTDLGKRQAQAAGATLGVVGELLVSPLTRTQQTAVLLNTSCELATDERIIEVDYGELDGTPLEAIESSLWEQIQPLLRPGEKAWRPLRIGSLRSWRRCFQRQVSEREVATTT